MALLVNKAKQFRNINERDMQMNVKPIPLLEETERYRDTASNFVVAAQIDEVPTMELPVVGVEQLATRVGLRAIPMSSSWSFPVMNGISIYDQPTWLLPVI